MHPSHLAAQPNLIWPPVHAQTAKKIWGKIANGDDEGEAQRDHFAELVALLANPPYPAFKRQQEGKKTKGTPRLVPQHFTPPTGLRPPAQYYGPPPVYGAQQPTQPYGPQQVHPQYAANQQGYAVQPGHYAPQPAAAAPTPPPAQGGPPAGTYRGSIGISQIHPNETYPAEHFTKPCAYCAHKHHCG